MGILVLLLSFMSQHLNSSCTHDSSFIDQLGLNLVGRVSRFRIQLQIFHILKIN